MRRHNPSVVTIHASSQSMRRHNPCVVTIHASSQSKRCHNPCVVTIQALSQSKRRHIHALSQSMVVTIHALSQSMSQMSRAFFIAKRKIIFGDFTSKETIDLLYVNPSLIYSLFNIFMVLEIRWEMGLCFEVGIGLGYSQRLLRIEVRKG